MEERWGKQLRRRGGYAVNVARVATQRSGSVEMRRVPFETTGAAATCSIVATATCPAPRLTARMTTVPRSQLGPLCPTRCGSSSLRPPTNNPHPPCRQQHAPALIQLSARCIRSCTWIHGIIWCGALTGSSRTPTARFSCILSCARFCSARRWLGGLNVL